MKLHFTYTKYQNNDRVAVQIVEEDGSPYATLSTNIPEGWLPENGFFMKDWSENERIAAAVRELGVFEALDIKTNSGHVTAQAYKAPETPPEPFEFDPEARSYAVWCTFKSEKPATNSCRFATRKEAELAGRELISRWMMPTGFEVRTSADPVNYTIEEGGRPQPIGG
jgi:hypothetical protein